MWDTFFTGVLAGFGIAIPVGAIALLIVETGMRCGFRCGASAGAGAASADLFYAGAAVAGGAAIASTMQTVETPFRLLSGVVLAALALNGLRRVRNDRSAPPTIEVADGGELLRTYGKFLGLTIINPLTVVYFASFIVGLGLADGLTAVEGVWFVAGAFIASLSWQTLLAALGAFAGARLSHRFRTLTVVLGNLIVMGLAVAILLR